MSHTKFQVSETCGSETEDLEYFSTYFYGSYLGPLARDHLGPWDLHLNKLGKGLLGIWYSQNKTCIKLLFYYQTRI